MLRRALPLVVLAVVLAGCGDDPSTRTESSVSGNVVVKTIEAAMQKAGTGRAQAFDGSIEYVWNFAGADRLLVINHSVQLESRQIGNVMYERRPGFDQWARYPLSQPIQPLPELTFFHGRKATAVEQDGVVTQYVVKVPESVLKGQKARPGDEEVAVTIFVDRYGLPIRTQTEGNGLAGERFSDWGTKILIETPKKVYRVPQS